MIRRHHPNKPDYPTGPAPGGGNYTPPNIRRVVRDEAPEIPRPEYPSHAAPGGPSTPKGVQSNRGFPSHAHDEPPRPKKNLMQGFRNIRQKIHDRNNTTPEEVEQLRLQAEKAKHRYSKKYYKTSERQLGGQMFGGSRQPSRQSVRRNVDTYRGSGFGFGNSLLDNRSSFRSGPIFGGLDSAFGTHSSRPEQKKGRSKQQPQKSFGSGLSDLFGY